jgi:hypothetical protein
MSDPVTNSEGSANRLLQTAFINRPIDLGAALRRAAVERYWLEQMGLPAWRPYIPSITAPTPRPIIRKSDQDREIADQERTERAMSSALTANGLQCIMERHRLELSYLLSAWPDVAPHAAAR